MPDREMVIKSLKWFRDRDSWREGIMIHDDHAEVRKQICDNAIAMLKEQEEKRTPKPIIHGHKEEYWGEEEICPDCGKKWQSEIIDTTHFCPGCGRAVKWE